MPITANQRGETTEPLRVWVTQCESQEDYERFAESRICAERYLLELHLAGLHQSGEPFTLPGYCLVCGQPSDFDVTLDGGERIPSGQLVPSWREKMVCSRCGLNNRQRLVAYFAMEVVHGGGSVYIMERVTQLYHALAAKLGEGVLVGSEYLGSKYPPGAIVDGIRHENAQGLSFADESFSVVVSCDVFEHIPDPEQGLREVRRVLKPDGLFLLTVPFHVSQLHSVRRADLNDGEIVHYFPAEYHGNPLSPRGSLVYTDHGWDLLDQMRAAGFTDVAVHFCWSYEYGHLNVLSNVIRAKKRASDPNELHSE